MHNINGAKQILILATVWAKETVSSSQHRFCMAEGKGDPMPTLVALPPINDFYVRPRVQICWTTLSTYATVFGIVRVRVRFGIRVFSNNVCVQLLYATC